MTSQATDISSFLAIKGALIEETYRAFRDWDLDVMPTVNLDRIRATNSIGAGSAGWLENILSVLKRRYDIAGPDRPLVQLAQVGWHLDEWRPVLLWHMCRADELLYDFLSGWLAKQRDEGIVLIHSDAVRDYLRRLIRARLGSVDAWKATTLTRVANGLLKTTVDFQLMHGRTVREFAAFRLPDPSFMYLLHALMDREQNTRHVIHAEDWRLFLLRPDDVEEELLRLHQYGRLHYERAGSFLELTLPSETAEAFVRSQAT